MTFLNELNKLYLRKKRCWEKKGTVGMWNGCWRKLERNCWDSDRIFKGCFGGL